jgi:hypothetical protein
MQDSKVDFKNTRLASNLLRLRNNIDIHRVIGFNAKELGEESIRTAISHPLLTHMQNIALTLICIEISKRYEPEKRYELNSIPGISHSLH